MACARSLRVCLSCSPAGTPPNSPSGLSRSPRAGYPRTLPSGWRPWSRPTQPSTWWRSPRRRAAASRRPRKPTSTWPTGCRSPGCATGSPRSRAKTGGTPWPAPLFARTCTPRTPRSPVTCSGSPAPVARRSASPPGLSATSRPRRAPPRRSPKSGRATGSLWPPCRWRCGRSAPWSRRSPSRITRETWHPRHGHFEPPRSRRLSAMTGTDPTGEISELSSTLASVEAVLDPEVMRREADNLRERAGDPGLWDDQDKAQAVTRRLSYLEGELARLEGLRQRLDETRVMFELAASANDEPNPDAADWAEGLRRIYLRWSERHGYATEIYDTSYAEEAGIKSTTFAVKAPYAHGTLRRSEERRV